MEIIALTSEKSTEISAQEPQSPCNCASPKDGASHPLWRDEIPKAAGPQGEFGIFTPPAAEQRDSYLKKIHSLGWFYEIDDMAFAPLKTIIHQAAHDKRHELTAQLREACSKVTSLLEWNTSRRFLLPSRKILDLPRKHPIRKTPEFREVERINAQLEHDLHKEIECPIATRGLSKEAFHIYLQIMQEERAAAQERAYAFTLTRTFSNRTHLVDALRDAGLTVFYTIGCKTIRLSNRTLEIPHLHGLALAKPGMCNPLDLINRILGNTPTRKNPDCRRKNPDCRRKTWVQPITPSDPESEVAENGGRTTAIANGFMAYAVYMCKNLDQPWSMKNRKRFSLAGCTHRLPDYEKSRLHPTMTRAEMEAFQKAKEAMRKRLGMPRTGRQTWIVENWEAIQASTPPPKYNYPANVITRDGFEYELKPDWDMVIQTKGVRSVACEYSRRLVWQEREADRIRLDLPPGSPPPYKSWDGECALDILLHLCRFRRVIETGESPECPIYSYHSRSGPVRPHADNLLPKDGA